MSYDLNDSVLTTKDERMFLINRTKEDKVIALAGNPNVGKSTIFNGLTGMHQHTGNWPGKTVVTASGSCKYNDIEYMLVDLPGTYSLMAHSSEEEIARDFICFGNPDVTIVICDATCMERNLNLVLQTMEITNHVIICVNLMDEAKSKKITINLKALEAELKVPVLGTNATRKRGIKALMEEVSKLSIQNEEPPVLYDSTIETALSFLLPSLEQLLPESINKRWVAIRLLDYDEPLMKSLEDYLNIQLFQNELVSEQLSKAYTFLHEHGIEKENIKDSIVSSILKRAGDINSKVVKKENDSLESRDLKIDRILTGRRFGIPIMILLLLGVFWITITGANYPSDLLYQGLFWIEDKLLLGAQAIHMPEWLSGILILGGYRVLAWVVSVMLPPMAIFFPLFTILEDLGYLPRVAFNLDHQFKKACTCGKQALTMCLGFGCNAAGIIGCRIIDSPRERLIAIITNNFVPCNGRFPTLISIITMFFIWSYSGIAGSFLSAGILTLVILFGIFMTFTVSRLLSKTIIKGVPSSFTLELPPYRKPQIGKVIVRSIFNKTLYVLGRAVRVAAPAGLLLWSLANININGFSLLSYCTDFLDPIGRLMGLDGVILTAFLLGFPANEIVVPIIIMAYLGEGSILELNNLAELKTLLADQGWTIITAICFMLFSLMHWPCSTTLITIHKETQSIKWTLLSAFIPTLIGFILCVVVALIGKLLFLV
ncbi:MAG: feoB [Herbinix sp.]|jgi:ferrous iron transport protein B|nr:feoB [Herbinix sp.]